MNPTIEKFGYPTTLVKEFEHWLVLVRPAQLTLGSLVLAAKGDATAYSALTRDAFAEQGVAVAAIETALSSFIAYERINYLMLMMVDPNVHFHVFPRYSDSRSWEELDLPDIGWPGQPRLETAINLDLEQLRRLTAKIASNFH